MAIDNIVRNYHSFLILEKALSDNTVDAYMGDVDKLVDFVRRKRLKIEKVKYRDLQRFAEELSAAGISSATLVRIVSSIKSFYRYLLLEGVVKKDPASLLESPKLGKHLPDVLTEEEIDQVISAVDLRKPEGQRNKAIMETLYGCGLRVSELVNLRVSNIMKKEGVIRIVGKGDKERLVPISKTALKEINKYMRNARADLVIKPGYEDFVFLNRRGAQLTRVMIFTIIKNAVASTGITKNVSPHTFRHSFATHLLENGASLRIIQEMLGHASITTTEVYTHLNSQMLKDTVDNYHPRARL